MTTRSSGAARHHCSKTWMVARWYVSCHALDHVVTKASAMLPLAYSDGAGAAGCTPGAKKRLLLFKVERLAVLAATASGTYSYGWCGDAIWTMLWLSWKPPRRLDVVQIWR